MLAASATWPRCISRRTPAAAYFGDAQCAQHWVRLQYDVVMLGVRLLKHGIPLKAPSIAERTPLAYKEAAFHHFVLAKLKMIFALRRTSTLFLEEAAAAGHDR